MNNNIDEAMKLATIKSHEMIQNIIMTYIWPKLCTVEKVIIPNDIPKIEFDKLLLNIFNIFKQTDPTFPENLKLTIRELVLESLKILCNDIANYLLEKVKSTGKIPPDIKIFKTKIIINENEINKIIDNDISSVLQSFNKSYQTKISRNSSGIICSNTKEYERLVNTTKKDAFGKTQYDYLNNAFKAYDNFDYEDMQMLYGTIHFIKTISDTTKGFSEIYLKRYNIKKITNHSYGMVIQPKNYFFSIFCNPDRKIGKNKKATHYQTYTKKRILNKLQNTIAPFSFPIIYDDKINFIHPLKEINPFDFNDKPSIKIVIDTRILLTDYLKHKEEFFYIPSMQEVEALGNTWDKVVEEYIINLPKHHKIYKKFRIGQFKDAVIKARNFIYLRYRGPYTNEKGYIQSLPTQPIHKKEFEDKILTNNRINKMLKETKNYKPSNRKNTILTRQKIKETAIIICFNTLVRCKYIKKIPNLKSDNKYHNININPFKIDKLGTKKLLNSIKKA